MKMLDSFLRTKRMETTNQRTAWSVSKQSQSADRAYNSKNDAKKSVFAIIVIVLGATNLMEQVLQGIGLCQHVDA